MRILLTSPRAPVTLELMRLLGKQGHEIFVADSLRFALGRFSRYCSKFVRVPRPVESGQDYARALGEVIKNWKIELLIPTCEEIFYLAAWRNELKCLLLADTFEQLSWIHNKWLFSQQASNTHAKVPESHLLTKKEFTEISDTENWVFKPVFSRFASQTLIGPSKEQVRDLSSNAACSWVAQQYKSGRELSTYSLFRDGKLLAHCTYSSSHRAGLGSGICFQSEDHQKIGDYVSEFGQQWNFTGQIGFDFIEEDCGKLWVLEGNPRATSGLHLVDNGALAVALDGGAVSGLPRQTVERSQMIGLAMLWFGSLEALRGGRWRYFLSKLFYSRDVLFRWDDLGPSVCLPISVLELFAIAIREKKTLQQASTFDIEWNGEPL